MTLLKYALLWIGGLGLLTLTACGSGDPTASNGSASPPITDTDPSAPAETANSETAAPPTSPGGHAPIPQAGGQVVESGPYHLEFVSAAEPTGAHLDFYLQTGDDHTPIPDAKVMADVQFPDGTLQSLPMAYDAGGQHYAATLNTTTPGEYQVAISAEIKDDSVRGRFSFQR